MEKLPDHLDLTVGQSYSLTLPGLGTSGYVWRERVAGEPGVVGVSWVRGFPPGAKLPAVGVSAPETLTIRALESGEVTLVLEQARPWERGRAPYREERITVRVSTPD
jgi:predicted secreted protein